MFYTNEEVINQEAINQEAINEEKSPFAEALRKSLEAQRGVDLFGGEVEADYSGMSKEQILKELPELEKEYAGAVDEVRSLYSELDLVDEARLEFIQRSKDEFVGYFENKRSGVFGAMLGASDCDIKIRSKRITTYRQSKNKTVEMVFDSADNPLSGDRLFTDDFIDDSFIDDSFIDDSFIDESKYDFKITSDSTDEVFPVVVYKPFKKIAKTCNELTKWQNISEDMSETVLLERYKKVKSSLDTVKTYINNNMVNEFIWHWDGRDFDNFDDMILEMGF